MTKLLKIILNSILVSTLLTTCNFNKKEVLKANLTGVGTCCSGSLTLYSNNSFKISYTVFEDDHGSTCKGNYRIEGEVIVLENDEINKIGNGILISEVGDLFTNQYKFEQETLIPLGKGNGLEIYYIDNSFFRIPCGIIQKENNGSNPTFIFNLCDSLLALDTIDMANMKFDPLPHISNCKVIFNLPEESKIIDVERQVYIYPTIWSLPTDNLLQFIQLDDLVYIAKRKLDVKKPNICIYPKIEITKSISKKFLNLNKDTLKNSLLNLLNRSDEWVYEPKKKDKEKKIWLSYVDNYKTGDFNALTNENFSVDYFEIFLIIKFELNRKIETKIFHTKHYYGN